MEDATHCPECGMQASVGDQRCPACGLPLPRSIPAIAVTEPWHRSPMVRLAFVAVAAIAVAVVVILMGSG